MCFFLATFLAGNLGRPGHVGPGATRGRLFQKRKKFFFSAFFKIYKKITFSRANSAKNFFLKQTAARGARADVPRAPQVARQRCRKEKDQDCLAEKGKPENASYNEKARGMAAIFSLRNLEI